jgi:hypothetical protein
MFIILYWDGINKTTIKTAENEYGNTLVFSSEEKALGYAENVLNSKDWKIIDFLMD